MAGSNHYFYLNSSNLADATKVYADMAGTILGPAGYYGNNVIYRYWNGSQFTNTGECIDSTPSPTPAPVTPAPQSSPTPAPITPAPVTPAPVTPAPVTPAPVTPAPVTPAPTSITLTQITLGVGTQSTSACNMSDTNFYWINDTQFINATKIYNTSAGTTVPTSQWYSDGTIAVQWQANGSFTDGSILNTIACTTPAPVAPQCYEYNITSDGGNTVTYGYTNCYSGNPSSATIPNGDSATICARESSANQITMSPNTGTVTYTQLCSQSGPTPAPVNPTLYYVDVSPNPGTCSTAATSTYWWADPNGYLTGTTEANNIAPSGTQVYSTSNYGNYSNTAGWYAVTQPGTGDDTLQYIGNTGIVGSWNYCPYTPPSPTPAPVVTSYEWGITMAEGEGEGSSATACSTTLGFDDVYTAESSLAFATVLYTDPNLQYVFDGSPSGGFFGNWYGLGDLSNINPSYAFWIDSNGDMLNRTSCAVPPSPPPITPAPVTPAPVTPAPITPSPVTPAPIFVPPPVTPAPVTPAPVTPQSYIAYGCEGGVYYLDYDGNLNTGNVVKFSGICATIAGTTTTIPTYYSYQEFSNCGECVPPPEPTPSPVAPTPSPVATPSPVITPAPTNVQCFRLFITQQSSGFPGTYDYQCCDGTWKYNQYVWGSTSVCSRNTGVSNPSNVQVQIQGVCSSGC